MTIQNLRCYLWNEIVMMKIFIIIMKISYNGARTIVSLYINKRNNQMRENIPIKYKFGTIIK